MFKDINSLQVKKVGGSYINLKDYALLEVKYGYNKLWSSDSGRNLAGKQSGTLIGIFPKIICQFGRLNKTQAETLIPILDAPRQVVKYYDPNKKQTIEMTTYTGDYEITNKSIIDSTHKDEGFQISFIVVQKR